MLRPALLLAALALAPLAPQPAEALPVVYTATLSGAAEAPPNASPGTGGARLEIDLDLLVYRIEFAFSDLLGVSTAAHVHGPTALAGEGAAGVITTTPSFPGFATGMTSGTYDQTFDMTLASTFNASFVTAAGGLSEAPAAFAAALAGGRAYLNIHSVEFPGGEIRGFFAPVPLPGAGALALLGLAALGLLRRRRA